jgi:hypothetical protein
MDIIRTPDSHLAGLPDYPFEPHYVAVDGVRMHYVEEGEVRPRGLAVQHQHRPQRHVPGAAGQPHVKIHDGHFLQEDAGPELARRINELIARTSGADSRTQRARPRQGFIINRNRPEWQNDRDNRGRAVRPRTSG